MAVSRSILVAFALLVLSGSVVIARASAYYSLTKESQTIVSPPPVELQEGTAENTTSTVYANGTSATVSLGTDLTDCVDNNTSDVDSSTDRGTHSNFTAQQCGPDALNDTLTEGNTEPNSEYVWISGDDDFVHKLNKSNLSGTEILNWDTGTSYPYGCECRIEDGAEYIYIVDPGANVDSLIKFHANNGTEVTRWDVSGYSGDAWGLTWNGSRWFISDKNDDLIYQVDPADPTIQERSFTYTGVGIPAGLAWDGSCLWAVDFGNDYVYQIDVYGNIQTSWTSANLTQPTGIAYDTTSGHLWIVSKQTEYLFKYYVNGTLIDSWNPLPGSTPEGVAYASVEDTYNYELDLEVQWTEVNYNETNEYLRIYAGSTGAENVTVDVWNGTAWYTVIANLSSGWNNVSVTSYLDASTFTIRFKGTAETNDTTQDTWDIDVTFLHIRTAAGSGDFNHVLKMVEKDSFDWEVRLSAYDQSNIGRLDNLSIYIRDSSNSTQIVILNGTYNQQTGPWFDLNATDTEYIWIHFEPSSSGTSYIYTYLEIRVPGSTTYARYVITFKIT